MTGALAPSLQSNCIEAKTALERKQSRLSRGRALARPSLEPIPPLDRQSGVVDEHLKDDKLARLDQQDQHGGNIGNLRLRMKNADVGICFICISFGAKTVRTTIILKDDPGRKAIELTNISEKTALVHVALEALVVRAAAERLAALGGQ